MAAAFSRSTLIREKIVIKNLSQIIRHMPAGVNQHRKPRWYPRAPSKQFKLPEKNHIPEAEEDQIMVLKYKHHDQMAALTQYLWEDYLRNSDVGEAAIIEAAKEEEEHRRLLAENESVNVEVASFRDTRVKIEAKEEKQRIALEIKIAQEQEQKRLSIVKKVILSEKKQLDMRIKSVDDLDNAISCALDNPVDEEFAIDKQGYIYRGRYTKSLQLPLEKKEKIPTHLSEGDRILGLDKQQQENR